MIISQHPDGDTETQERKKVLHKIVFEEQDIELALESLDRRDVCFSLTLTLYRDLKNHCFQHLGEAPMVTITLSKTFQEIRGPSSFMLINHTCGMQLSLKELDAMDKQFVKL